MSPPVKSTNSPFWKGLLKARDQLRDGFRFKLGCGRTSFWFEDWSGHGALGSKVPFINISDTTHCLRDLVRDGHWELNTQVSNQFYQELLKINPALDEQFDDVWCWQPCNTGVYSASSAYNWLNPPVIGPQQVNDWMWVWKREVPEKMKVFTWLVLHDATQVNEHRYRCQLVVSPNCMRCSNAIEDNLHCLRVCPHSREVWTRFNAIGWPGFNAPTIQSWVLSRGKGRNATLFIAILWGLWRWRNDMVLGENKWSISYVCDWIRLQHRDICSWLGKMARIGSDGVKRWVKPPLGSVSLMVDGAYRATEHLMGMGGVIRDEAGDWITGFYAGSAGGDPVLAEIQALRLGLLLAWRRKLKKVECGMDCLEVVNALGKGNHNFHIYGREIMDLQLILARKWEVKLRHVNCDENAPADLLAGIGVNLMCVVAELEAPPAELLSLLANDLLAA